MIEVWKNIKGFPDYEISSAGRVRSRRGKTNRILKPRQDSSGYYAVALYNSGGRIQFSIHRLVAMYFLNFDADMDVNHRDGDKANNDMSNLEMATRTENNRHARKNGFHRLHTGPRLSFQQCQQIRSIEGFYSQNQIAAFYDISRITVYNIQKYKTRVKS